MLLVLLVSHHLEEEFCLIITKTVEYVHLHVMITNFVAVGKSFLYLKSTLDQVHNVMLVYDIYIYNRLKTTRNTGICIHANVRQHILSIGAIVLNFQLQQL